MFIISINAHILGTASAKFVRVTIDYERTSLVLGLKNQLYYTFTPAPLEKPFILSHEIMHNDFEASAQKLCKGSPT